MDRVETSQVAFPLVETARHLGIPERTMRRAANEGLIKGERQGPRRYLIPAQEEVYLRDNWALLADLREVLRTEPNVKLALLFGSFARGSSHQNSDLDLMVEIKNESSVRYRQLLMRIQNKIKKEVQIVSRETAETSPQLMVNIIEEGRVLIDREQNWTEIRDSLAKWQRKARSGESLESLTESWSDGR